MNLQRVALYSLAGSLGLALLSIGNPPLVDLWAEAATESWRNSEVGRTAELISTALGPALAALTMALLLTVGRVAELRRDRSGRRTADLTLRSVAVLACCWSTQLLSELVHQERGPHGGHVTAVAAVGLTAVLVSGYLAVRWQPLIAVIAGLATALTAACRVLVSVHCLTDTLGAVLAVLGVGLLLAMRLGFVVSVSQVGVESTA
ncbi:hypothetical protein D5S17_26100 [Pseudonocardiaceae bacterium YIM PH 21723]|nr:hypothetical protein D5S17_26100 [Pseudonocardiaceae bacterium YIM PH 21723]